MEKREAQDIFYSMTKEELYDDNQNLFKKIDIQHNQLRISNDVIMDLKHKNKLLDKEIIELKKELNKILRNFSNEKEKNKGLLKQIDILKDIKKEDINIKNTDPIHFNNFNNKLITKDIDITHNKSVSVFNPTEQKNRKCKLCKIDFINDVSDVDKCKKCIYNLEIEGYYEQDEDTHSNDSIDLNNTTSNIEKDKSIKEKVDRNENIELKKNKVDDIVISIKNIKNIVINKIENNNPIINNINDIGANRLNKYKLMIKLYEKLKREGITDTRLFTKYIKNNEIKEYTYLINDTKSRRLFNKCKKIYEIKDFIDVDIVINLRILDKIFTLEQDHFELLKEKLK